MANFRLQVVIRGLIMFDSNDLTILATQDFCFSRSIIQCTCFFALLSGEERKIDEALSWHMQAIVLN